MPAGAISDPAPVAQAAPANQGAPANEAKPTPSASVAVWAKLKRLPRWSYLALVSVALITTIFYVYHASTAQTAKLRILYQPSFRSASLSVVVDGTSVYSGTVSGIGKKRFGLFDKNSGLSKTVGVAPGTHAVQVHLSAPAEGFEQAKVSYAEFSDTKENILVISSLRRAGLNLAFSGGAIATAPVVQPDSPQYPRSVFSILFSVLGTMLSASISFMVQEFWRNHKQRIKIGT